MTDLSPLITALEKAEGPSRELDFAIHEFLCPATPSIISGVQPSPGFGKDAISMQMDPRPRYTSSLDAAIALTERLLPGWLYSVCHCYVTDDAWLMPDFNDPAHAERLMREFGNVEGDPSQYWQDITDVAMHPPRGLALALCTATLKALASLKTKEAADV